MNIQPRRNPARTSHASADHKRSANVFGSRSLMASVFLFVLALGWVSYATAADVLVEHRAIDVKTSDGVTFGLVEVVIRNVGSTPVTDVNLRSASQTSQMLGNGVLHFGDIPAGGSVAASGEMAIEGSDIDSVALQWSMQCDQCDLENGDSVESSGVLDGGE